MPSTLVAHWEPYRAKHVSDWIEQPTRRVIDTEEERLQEVLTYLRLKRPVEFERISAALTRALPEFERLDFIDEAKKGFSYRPAFILRGRREAELARESIGTGAWTFLCAIAAARAAKVTGARLLVLDEPHLYLHPGLERLLINELLEPTRWDGEPLQILAATHSPTFVDAAVQRGRLAVLDWVDKSRSSAGVYPLSSDALQFFSGLTSTPSDLLYADRVVFVEGPSDVEALRVLSRERCGIEMLPRFVPLKEADAIATEVARYFNVIMRSHGLGFQTRGLLVLDGDKKLTHVPAWAKAGADLDPTQMSSRGLDVVWADGDHGNDLESVFCDQDFLNAYFQAHGATAADLVDTIKVEISKVKFDSPTAIQKKDKGCEAIRRLHDSLLSGAGVTKTDDLASLMRFYVQEPDAAHAVVPRARLKPLEDALRKVAEG